MTCGGSALTDEPDDEAVEVGFATPTAGVARSEGLADR